MPSYTQSSASPPKESLDASKRKINQQESNSTTDLHGSNFKVVIRIRPPLPRELTIGVPFQSAVF